MQSYTFQTNFYCSSIWTSGSKSSLCLNWLSLFDNVSSTEYAGSGCRSMSSLSSSPSMVVVGVAVSEVSSSYTKKKQMLYSCLYHFVNILWC